MVRAILNKFNLLSFSIKTFKASQTLLKYKKVNDLINVINRYIDKKNNDEEEKYLDYQEYYKTHFGQEIAFEYVLNVLRDNHYGENLIEVSLYHPYSNKWVKNKISAYHVLSDDFYLLELYSFDSQGNSEGFTFEFKMISDINHISEIKMPDCSCGEIYPTTTVEYNYIDCNCDTYGVLHGVKAECIYFFYVADKEKYAVVKTDYWCL